jgi:predicted nucleic acid-binding protein
LSSVLPDSSAWIDYLRGNAQAIARLDRLLTGNELAICGPVYAEVVSGAGDRPTFDRLASRFSSLSWLDAPESAWRQIAELRFALARQGTSAHALDLLIAVTAFHAGHLLLTRDRDFVLIGRILPIEIDFF